MVVVYHMVWIKVKEGAEASAVQRFCDESSTRLSTINGVLAVRAGRNFTERAKGFDLGLFVTLESRAALDHYAVCAEHVAYKSEVLAPILGEVMAMDFEDAKL